MKSITKLFAGVLALAGTLAGCQTLLDGSNLTINPEGVVELDKTQQEVTVAVTADCNWVVSSDADWITFSDAVDFWSGKGRKSCKSIGTSF